MPRRVKRAWMLLKTSLGATQLGHSPQNDGRLGSFLDRAPSPTQVNMPLVMTHLLLVLQP